MVKERLHYIDVTKGVLIIFLCVFHLGVASRRAGIDVDTPYMFFWDMPQVFFICFYIQCFYIITGYCSNFESTPTSFLKKQAKQLLIPLLFFSFINECILPFINEFDGIHLQSIASLWFFKALLIGKIIIFVLHRLTVSQTKILVITLLLLVVGVALNQYKIGNNIFFYQHAFIASFFIELGNFLKAHNELFEKLTKYGAIIYMIIIAGRLLHFYWLPNQDAMICVLLVQVPCFVITSFCGSMGLLWICKRISSNKLLEFFGRNTLVIYGTHFGPYLVFCWLAGNFIGLSTQLHAIGYALVSFCALILSMWIVIELLNSKYLRYCIGKF